MSAAYAKHGVMSCSGPSIAVEPNTVLYVSTFSYFGEEELRRIFGMFEGFER